MISDMAISSEETGLKKRDQGYKNVDLFIIYCEGTENDNRELVKQIMISPEDGMLRNYHKSCWGEELRGLWK